MAELAARVMTLAEFLSWDAPGQTPWQLFEGYPVAMAPSGDDHGTVAGNLVGLLKARLAAPCRVRVEAGILLPHRGRSYYVADLAVSCRPAEPGRPDIPDPLLIVEVLSPSTEGDDRKVKLPDYRLLPTVREIVYVDPARAYCEVHRRLDGGRWQMDILTSLDDRLRLAACDGDIPLAEVYENVALAVGPR
ncbi:MAG: Uma2 family endonuclease [Alphaproteobacteria bacterium]|nr:Uma2 family endonuclease [Alphaproteobacteria bacterium]